MATAERPPAKIDGKPNPAYQAWYRQWVKAGKPALESTPEPEVLTLRVVKLARNISFVYCDLDGNKVAVRCKKSVSRKLRGKMIPVAATQEDGETIYTHAP